jgi:hypothetical protein
MWEAALSADYRKTELAPTGVCTLLKRAWYKTLRYGLKPSALRDKLELGGGCLALAKLSVKLLACG